MSKHTILFACGHIADAEVEGSEYEKKQKLIYLKTAGRHQEKTDNKAGVIMKDRALTLCLF